MSDEILQDLRNVEAYNEQFRQPNPKGRYPLCHPAVYTLICERCGQPAIRSFNNQSPCPAVPPDQRWGEDCEEPSR